MRSWIKALLAAGLWLGAGCAGDRLTGAEGSGEGADTGSVSDAADGSGAAADAAPPDVGPGDTASDTEPADTAPPDAADTAEDAPRDTAADTAFDGDAAEADGSADTTDPRAGCPELHAPGIEYVSYNSFSCERWNGNCDAGYLPFTNRCGCGCSLASGSCPSESDSTVTWVSRDAAACAFEVPACPEGFAWFYASCGCGCAPVPPPPCAPELFLPAGGVVEGAACGEALFCGRSGSITDGIGAVTTAYPDAVCTVDTDPLCRSDASFSCRAFVDSVDPSDYGTFCALSVTGFLSQIRCSLP